MKALAKTMFVLCILTAGSLGMQGQNTIFVNDIQPLLAYSSDTQSEIELSAVLTASTYQFYMEEKIQFEDWMIVQEEWKNGSETELTSVLKVEPEPEMLLESWMIQPYSTVSQDWDFLTEVIEEPLVVRKWMICCTDWNLETTQDSRLKNPDLTSQ
jgi:hypothetical protein